MGTLVSSTTNSSGGDSNHRPWANLPAIALYAIATRHLTSLHDFFVLPRVCSPWRSVLKGTLDVFIASKPPMLLLAAPSASNNNTVRLYSTNEDMTYKVTIPAIGDGTLLCAGYSHGQLIMVDKATRKKPMVLDPITGSRIDFPAATRRFSYGHLSAPPTAPDCELFLVTKFIDMRCKLFTSTNFINQRCSVRGSSRQWRTTAPGGLEEDPSSPFDFDWGTHDQLPELRQLAELRRADGVFPAIGELDGESLVVAAAGTVFRQDSMGMLKEVRNLGHRSLFVSSHTCDVLDVRGVEGVEGGCMYWAGCTGERGNYCTYGWGKVRLASTSVGG